MYVGAVLRLSATSTLDRYLAQIRLRAALFLVVRGIVAGVGAGGLLFSLGAWIAGPLADGKTVAMVWVVALAGALGILVLTLRPARRLAGGGASRLLGGVRTDLVSKVRSAFELAHAENGVSRELALAHAMQVERELGQFPPSRVVPWSWLKHPSIGAGFVGVLSAVALVFAVDRTAGGVWALLHPGRHDDTGAPIAAAFSDVQARLIFPAYLAREPRVVHDFTRLEVPAGTTIELSGRVRMATTAAELELAGTRIAMTATGDHVRARFLARVDSALGLRTRTSDGTWVRDATARSIRIVPDEAPAVVMVTPNEDAVVEPDDAIAVIADISDDVGIGSIDLVVRFPEGREQRRRMATPEPSIAHWTGSDILSIAELEITPGDRIDVWIEAADNDDVTGPHVGRSSSRTLTIASAATRREESLAELDALVNLAIHTLADRLETLAPEEDNAARARRTSLRSGTERLVRALSNFATNAEGGVSPQDATLYGEAGRRIHRIDQAEEQLHGATLGGFAARQRVDARMVDELEEDVLLLNDLLMRARIGDAAEIARELESLRREISSLLQELQRADTPEARAALLSAIARAEQRLADLRARMSRLGTAVPEEFANARQDEAAESQDALAAIRQAVESGNLDAAQQALTRLEQEIDALAGALGNHEESFAEERFGPRNRALADAYDRVMGLEAEQRELARRTTEVRAAAARRALERAGEHGSDNARRLAPRSQRVQQALAPIDRERLSSMEREALDAVRQRLRDTEDALSTGDLGEANRMVESAEEELGDLARDLSLDAMMFSGHDGHTSRAAQAANDAERQLRDLRRALDDALPRLGSHLDASESGQMRSDAPRQRDAERAASDLAEAFGQGPDGTPLSPEASEALRDVTQWMNESARHLDGADPAEAARAQEEAARRLTELREQLDSERQRSSGGGGSEGGQSRPEVSGRVRIRDRSDFEGPMELRRRLLDAMHDAPPDGYEESVRRYYESLLR
jgi:hypothetical protein